jgi:hypothetical protein
MGNRKMVAESETEISALFLRAFSDTSPHFAEKFARKR